MWNFVEILLGHMIEELKLRSSSSSSGEGDGEGSLGVGVGVGLGVGVGVGGIGGGDSEHDCMVVGSPLAKASHLRAKQMQVLDLEHNILQAKGLRTALCVRIVQARSHAYTQGEAVVYVLRVEDVESGLQWVVQRRYRYIQYLYYTYYTY
jgi:hypothetical protein